MSNIKYLESSKYNWSSIAPINARHVDSSKQLMWCAYHLISVTQRLIAFRGISKRHFVPMMSIRVAHISSLQCVGGCTHKPIAYV